MKKLCKPELFCSFVTACAFLMTTTASEAGYYVLNLKTPQTNVKVFLSVEPDTETDARSEAQDEQEQSFSLLSGDNAEGEKFKTVGGLPVSESTPSAQSQPPELTSSDNDENQECGAVGGLPVPQSCEAISSPISVCLIDSNDRVESNTTDQLLTTQPTIVSTPTIRYLETGRARVAAWLERGVACDTIRFYQISSGMLEKFVLMFARLVAMEADEMYTCQPFVRFNNYIFDSSVNPRWYRGRIAIFVELLDTAILAGIGFTYGIPGLGIGGLIAGGLFIPLTACYSGYTRFTNQFLVSFTFNSNNLLISQEIYNLQQQIVKILQLSGGFNLLAFRFDQSSASQTLTFNVRMPKSVNARRLRLWLVNRNHHLGAPFQIEVSSVSELIHTKKINKGYPETDL
ncbi:hypothetical protein [Endozoicomonas sp. ISHI1]|nr:hypothetical protein [Endozoicomonas sp. ISHI1]